MLCDRGGLILSATSLFSLLDDLLILELMLELESTFLFVLVVSVTSEFHLALIIKYESKPCAVGLLNIIFLLTSSTTIVSIKILSTLEATFFKKYPYIASILGILHLIFYI